MHDLNFLKYLIISFAFLAMNSTQSSKSFNTTPATLCNLTTYVNTCHNTLHPLLNLNNTYNSGILYKLSVQVAKRELLTASMNFNENGKVYKILRTINEIRVLLALQSCRKILDLAIYYLDWAVPTNVTSDLAKPKTQENFRTWISGVGSLLETCKDEFHDDRVRKVVIQILENSTKTVSNSLDIMYQIIIHSNVTQSLDMENVTSYKSTSDWPPTWLSGKDKMLLENPKVANGPNLIVASDGSGDYKTITEALRVVPRKSNQRFVIYVRKGIYYERVIVDKDKWNVLMYGDGMDKTIVSGNRNSASGIPTFESATFSVFGKGFVAEYMAFRNTAGPQGFQAVAMLSTSDHSVFFRCRFDGYQDTLLSHIMVQFYRECKIHGTIDFIFGQASVVIQNSDIIVKRLMHGQGNTITAQGKDNARSNSALSIQKCRIITNEDLTGVNTYLGRPWKAYSTTVFMESFMGNLINPRGWMNWIPGVTPPNTIYYAEYMNNGPGADTRNRINWNGVKRSISPREANYFTVRSLLRGNEWIPGKHVPFHLGL